MKRRHVIALFVSAVLPFLVGLAIFETSGFQHLLSERGKLHYTEARHLAAELDQSRAREKELEAAGSQASVALTKAIAEIQAVIAERGEA